MKFTRQLSLFLLAFSFCSLSFASFSHHQTYTPPNNYLDPIIMGDLEYLAPFTQLKVGGNADLILRMGSQPSLRVLNADTENQIVSFKSQGDMLSIYSGGFKKDSQKNSMRIRPLIEITVSQLDSLSTEGSASVQGQLISQSLVIQSKGSSQIKLKGMVNVEQIKSSSKSQVHLYWVNSNNLVVKANDNSVVQLAGSVGVLHATLTNNAQLKGQYLRAQQAIVQTDNNAFAGVLAIQALRAFASEDSNIFYYKYPRTLNDFSLQSGNILQVDWRP